MTTSWKRSREARLWHRLDPVQASRIMVDCHGDGAGAEVLLRAFLAERDMKPSAVRFWLEVHGALITRQAASVTPAQAGAAE